jgi:hypothetical protein
MNLLSKFLELINVYQLLNKDDDNKDIDLLLKELIRKIEIKVLNNVAFKLREYNLKDASGPSV